MANSESGNANKLGQSEKYCISCGEIISSEANICPDCGAPQSDDNNAQSQTGQQSANMSISEENKFKTAIDDKKVEGWDVKSREGDRVIMIKRGYGSLGGHVLVAALTAWWTLFIGNVVYATYKYFIDTDQMVMRRSEFIS
jgi:hypothetical protein